MPSLSRAQDTSLTLWWWGEQELPDLQDFVNESAANYSAAAVDTMLQDTAVVISQFQTATAAGEAPDMQYFWNGIYHMESVWFGYAQPVNGLVSDDVIKASSPTLLSNYGGNVYRVGWYPIPMVWYYNRDLFDKAGLDGDTPPATWDDLLDARDKLMSAGIAPIGGGTQDGYWGEWYLGHALPQNLDTTGEALDLFIGERSFREPKNHEHWSHLQELRDMGFLNKDMALLELYPGIDLIVAGELAMGLSIGTRLPADSKATDGRIGCMVMPVYGTGAMVGIPILDVQGIGISADSEAAAAYLEYLHSPERPQAFWDVTGWIPSNSNFDASVIEDETVRSMWQNWGLSANIPYVANLTPGQFYVQACREAVGPDMILAVDVAYCWPDWKAALRAIEMFADADIYFVGTPLPSDDIEGYGKLCAASSVRIATGEWLNTRFECLEAMDRGGVDVIQPDVGRVGGLAEACRVADQARDRSVIIVPHCWKSAIGIAASLHLAIVAGTVRSSNSFPRNSRTRGCARI